MQQHPGRVLLGLPSSGHDISPRFFRSFVELDRYDLEWAGNEWARAGEPEDVTPLDIKLLANWVTVEATSNIAKQRNRIVDFFLTEPDYEGCEWLWFVDSDMVLLPDTLHRMLARAHQFDLKILGALCVIVNSETKAIPTIFLDDPDTITKVCLDYEDDTVSQVCATGTGCLLIHRDVLVKMQEDRHGSKNAWFGFDVRNADNGDEFALGEDVSFCLRARDSGFAAHVDTTNHVGHHKGPRTWWPDDCRADPATPSPNLAGEATRDTSRT